MSDAERVLREAHEAAMIELSDKHPDLHARSVDMTESTIMRHLYEAFRAPQQPPSGDVKALLDRWCRHWLIEAGKTVISGRALENLAHRLMHQTVPAQLDRSKPCPVCGAYDAEDEDEPAPQQSPSGDVREAAKAVWDVVQDWRDAKKWPASALHTIHDALSRHMPAQPCVDKRVTELLGNLDEAAADGFTPEWQTVLCNALADLAENPPHTLDAATVRAETLKGAALLAFDMGIKQVELRKSSKDPAFIEMGKIRAEQCEEVATAIRALAPKEKQDE